MKKTMLVSLALAIALVAIFSSVALAHRSAASGSVDPIALGGKVCALVVGISDYAPAGPGGPDLNFADDDADDVVTALTTVYGVGSGNITILKDSAATSSAILAGLNTAKSCTGPNDDLFVFLSGHGTIRIGDPDGDGEKKDNAFLTHEGGTSGVILDGQLASIVSGDNARRKIVLGDFSFPSGFNDDMKAVGNILYIAAAKGEEFEVGGTISNSVFTYKFIELGIIAGNADDPNQNPHVNTSDGKVTLEEAFDYANHVRVPRVPGAKPSIVDNDTTKDVFLSP